MIKYEAWKKSTSVPISKMVPDFSEQGFSKRNKMSILGFETRGLIIFESKWHNVSGIEYFELDN